MTGSNANEALHPAGCSAGSPSPLNIQNYAPITPNVYRTPMKAARPEEGAPPQSPGCSDNLYSIPHSTMHIPPLLSLGFGACTAIAEGTVSSPWSHGFPAHRADAPTANDSV